MSAVDPITSTSKPKGGRPTALTPRTHDLIVASIRTSANVKLACEHARISTRAYGNWLTRGRTDLAAHALNTGKDVADITPDDFPPHTQDPEGTFRFVRFLLDVSKAMADYQLQNLALIGEAAKGTRVVKTKTTTKPTGRLNADGTPIMETITETTEYVERSWQAAAWLLERRFPHEYGMVNRVEHSGPDGGPIPVDARVASLVESVRSFKDQTGNTQPAIEGRTVDDDHSE